MLTVLFVYEKMSWWYALIIRYNELKRISDLDVLKTALKVVIGSVVVLGLNQNLLPYLADINQKATAHPPSAPCACLPTSCMCSPSSGCGHNSNSDPVQNKEISGQKAHITVCRPNPGDHEVINFFLVWNVPILTTHVDGLIPDLSLTNLDQLLYDLASQQNPTPPDKPPQTSFV